MDYYGADPNELRIKQTLAQAAALRGGRAPQGQVVGNGGFQHYVAPHWTQQIAPVTGELAAQVVEGRAADQQAQLSKEQQSMLQNWISAKPQAKTTYGAGEEGPTMNVMDPTDLDNQKWATEGLKNPLSRTLAQKTLEDSMINAPIRAEKAADKKSLLELTNRRYDEDRRARAELSAQQSQARLDMLTMRLEQQGENSAAGIALRREIAAENNRLREMQIQAGLTKSENDIKSRETIASNKLGAAGGKKGMNPTQLKEIAGFQDQIARQDSFAKTFKPEYIGPRAAALVETGFAGSFASRDPKTQEMAQWWRDFKANDNVERHALFGSALTAAEKSAWKATTVTPLSSPEQIQSAIATRKQIADAAMRRRVDLYQNGPEAATGGGGGALPNSTRPKVSPQEQGSRDSEAARILVNEALKMPMTQEEYDGVVRDALRKGWTGPIPPRVPAEGDKATTSGGWTIRKVP